MVVSVGNSVEFHKFNVQTLFLIPKQFLCKVHKLHSASVSFECLESNSGPHISSHELFYASVYLVSLSLVHWYKQNNLSWVFKAILLFLCSNRAEELLHATCFKHLRALEFFSSG